MMQLQELNLGAANYLHNIDPQLWVTAYYKGSYWGHKTSNVVESTNKVFREDRELPILSLLNTIWHYVMDQRFKRHTKATYPTIITSIHFFFNSLLACRLILWRGNKYSYTILL